MSAGRDPLVVGLEIKAKFVISDPEVAVFAAHDCGRHYCLNFLSHHAYIHYFVVIVPEAVKTQTVIKMTKKRNVVLKHHIRPPYNTPGRTTRDASDTDYAGSDDGHAGSGDAARVIITGRTIDNSVCLFRPNRDGRSERRDGYSGK
jgi:hypothetical protein